MKKIFIALMAIAGITTCINAQTVYNMNVRLNDGTVVTYPADNVVEVTFTEGQPEEVINLLDPAVTPDATFRSWIKTNLANGEDVYTNLQALAYTGAIRLFPGVKDATGIEYFVNADSVVSTNNYYFTSLDLRSLKNLKYLRLYTCTKLTSLKLDENAPLEALDLGFTLNTGFDYTQYANTLKAINLTKWGITEFNVRQFPVIEEINLGQNNLTSIDCSNISTLKSLEVITNQLQSVNVDNCVNLEVLNIGNNLNINSFSMQNCNKIRNLMVWDCYLNSIDVSGLSETLEILNAQNNNFTEIDLRGFSKLERIQLQGNQIVNLDLAGCTSVKWLRVEGMSTLQSLNVVDCEPLDELQCYETGLTSLDLSHNNKLTQGNITFNPELETIELGAYPDLIYMSISYNKLKRADISQFPHESYIDCSCNEPDMQIRVWSDFDMENPPENVVKDETATFVYDFTED